MFRTKDKVRLKYGFICVDFRTMHGGIKKQITGKKILGKYTKNQLTGILKAMKEITQNYQDSRYPIASIFQAIKMWSTSNKMRQDICRHLLNVLKILRILFSPSMESLHYQSISKPYHNMMHQNLKR